MNVDFLDTNVIIYLFDDTAPRKRKIAEGLVQTALHAGTSVISHQVVQETLNVLTRKIAPPMRPDDARDFLDKVLAPLWRVMPSAQLYQRAIVFQARFKCSFYDGLIVAAAIDAGCTHLLTEDLQDGQRFDSLLVVNPFA